MRAIFTLAVDGDFAVVMTCEPAFKSKDYTRVEGDTDGNDQEIILDQVRQGHPFWLHTENRTTGGCASEP